jgi:hypothetical protein
LHGLAEALEAYYGEAVRSGRDYVLSDIATLRNYTYGWTGECRQPRIYLHDVQTYLAPNDIHSPALESELKTFYDWASELAPLPEAEAA